MSVDVEEKQNLINKLKDEKIIDGYGYVNYHKLFEDYGIEGFNKFLEFIKTRDILLTISVEQLMERAIKDTGDILIQLTKNKVPYIETKELLELLSAIHECSR